jgi:glutathione peroxidase
MYDLNNLVLLGGAALAACSLGATLIPDPRSEFQRDIKERSLHEFTVRDIDGAEVELSRYRGKVVLVVNVATLAPTAAQLYSLQSLQAKFGERGFAVLAFPSHSFGKEPRPDADVKQTCLTRYKVGFDLFGKVAVLGKDQCPLYSFLTSREKHPQYGGAIDNDYAKFLVGKDGRVAGRFKAMQDPLTPEIVHAIERALAA